MIKNLKNQKNYESKFIYLKAASINNEALLYESEN